MSNMIENKWYIYIDSAHTGPYKWDEVIAMHARKEIDDQVLVWREGQDDWLPLSELDPSLRPNVPSIPNVSLPDIPPQLPAHVLGELNSNAVEDSKIPYPKTPFEDEVDDAIGSLGENIDEDLPTEEKEFLEKWNSDEGHITQDIENLDMGTIEEELDIYVATPIDEELLKKVEKIENEQSQEVTVPASEIEEQPLFEEATLPIPETTKAVPEDFEVEETADFSEFEVDKTTDWGKLKIGLSVVFTIIILISVSKLFSNKKMIPSLRALKTAESRRLMRAVNSNEDIKVAVSPSEDGREIWFASNQKGPGIFHIKLNSIQGRVLAEKEIEVVGKTNFNNYVGVFRFLKLKKGLKVSSGEYRLTGKILLTGRRARLFNYLKESSIFKSFDFVKNFETSYEVKKDVRISKFQGERFELQLKEYANNRKIKEVQPLLERLQKFRTMITLAENILRLYKKELKKVRKGRDIRSFEVKYAKQMAPLLQGLILENHKISVMMVDSDSEAGADYVNLVSFGRNLGKIVSDMVTTVERKPKVRLRTRQRLVIRFNRDISKLISHGREYMKSIQKRIEDIK